MRTDRLLLKTAALALLLTPAAAAGLAAQDTLEAAAPPAHEARRTGDLIATGRDLRVAADEVVDGRVVVAGGNVRVEGHVTGDVTVTGGDLRLVRGGAVDGSVQVTGGSVSNAGTIGGDVRVVGGRLVNDDGGVVRGEMRLLDEEVRERAAASGRGAAARAEHRFGRGGWMGYLGEGLSGLASTVAMGLLLAGLGAAIVFYARPQLDRVSDSVRGDTGRAVALGIAANFLVLPTFILGMVLLALTLIGIPLLLLFAPLYWVAVVALAAFGLVAVGHAVGERTAERSGSLEARHRNSYTYVFTGLGVMLAPLVAANLLKLTGFLGLAGDLLEAVAYLGLWLAATVGVGALLITRGGMGADWRWRRRRSYDPIIDGEAFGGRDA